jgi:hypothetical protein
MEKAGDPKYKYGRQSSSFDPQSQTEAIGNDPVKASTYGVKNLKYVADNLTKWTSEKTNDYDDLEELYGEMLGVWSRYVGHVISNVGGVKEDIKKPEQSGVVYSNVDKAIQKESVEWLNENVFDTPEWLIDKNILQNIDYAGYFETMRSVQERHLNNVLSFDRIGRLLNAETVNTDYYSALDLFTDIQKGLFTGNDRKLDIYERDLQRTYVDRLGYLMTGELQRGRRGGDYYDVSQSDVRAIVRGQLKSLQTQLRSSMRGSRDTVTRFHYDDLLARVDMILNPEN